MNKFDKKILAYAAAREENDKEYSDQKLGE
jgi:hypothetical protein